MLEERHGKCGGRCGEVWGFREVCEGCWEALVINLKL